MPKVKLETPEESKMVPCPECDGKDEDCTRCGGSGKVVNYLVDPEEYKREKANKQ